jgi:hypothetical protein
MRVVQPWNDRGAADVDKARRRSLEPENLSFSANAGDSIASNRNGVRDRVTSVNGVNPRVVQNESGRGGRLCA